MAQIEVWNFTNLMNYQPWLVDQVTQIRKLICLQKSRVKMEKNEVIHVAIYRHSMPRENKYLCSKGNSSIFVLPFIGGGRSLTT